MDLKAKSPQNGPFGQVEAGGIVTVSEEYGQGVKKNGHD